MRSLGGVSKSTMYREALVKGTELSSLTNNCSVIRVGFSSLTSYNNIGWVEFYSYMHQ